MTQCDKLGPLITWWEIRVIILMTWWGNWGPLMAQWKTLIIKVMGKLGKNGKLGPWWRNWTWGAFDDVVGKLETLAIGKLGPWWPDGKIGGPRPRILFKRFNTASLHSSKLMSPEFLLRNFRYHASWKLKRNTWAPIPINCLIFQRLCDDYKCLILVFSVIYLDSWGYIGWGTVRV